MKSSMKSIWSSQEGSYEPVKCIINREKGSIVLKGVLGSVEQVFKGDDIHFSQDGSVIVKSKSSLGYFVSRICSLIKGVTEGYFIELELFGRGYGFSVLSDKLLIRLGFIHYVGYKSSTGIKILGSKNKIIIFGLDLEEVNRVASVIRGFRVPDAYKGKGIRYVGEELVLKVGKKS